ncbi:unnamed protein product [Sphacelaria rigidula]
MVTTGNCPDTNWPIVALDVQTAFSNGELQEAVFCRQPYGFETSDPTTREAHAMQLRRALYGLRQIPNVWNSTTDTELRKIVFSATISDPWVYTTGYHGVYISC